MALRQRIVARVRRPGEREPPARPVRLSDTQRTETFSDGVFAIAITLLVLNLSTPRHSPGELLDSLLRQWPAYLAYGTSFLFIGVIWFNHHQVFTGLPFFRAPRTTSALRSTPGHVRRGWRTVV
jgi:Endosomal/lysosomal potassium channel TMEM175